MAVNEASLNKDFDFRFLNLTTHAFDRYNERVKQANKGEVLKSFKTMLKQAKYIGEVTCEEKQQKTHMFVTQGNMAVYVSLDLKYVVTIMEVKQKVYLVYDEDAKDKKDKDVVPVVMQLQEAVEDVEIEIKSRSNPLHSKLLKLYNTEFRRYDAIENKASKTFKEFELKHGIEVAGLQLKIFKAKSEKIKVQYGGRINEIQLVVKINQEQLKKIQDDKRKISRALASLMSV